MSDRLPCSFGYFQNDGTEFVVTEIETPRPLVNYFWNERFISGISHHGGGEGVYKERAMQYIDPNDRALLVRDGHRYFYFKDLDRGTIWNPGWHPVQTKLDSYRCRHGFGYSILESSKDGIETTCRVFVPEHEPCEIWTLTVKNTRKETARIRTWSFAEWALEGYPRYCDYFGMLKSEYFADLNVAQGMNKAVERRHPVYDGFIASSLKPTGYDLSRDAFVGPFGQVSMPAAVRDGKCRNSLGSCEKLASALEHTLELAPGASETFHVFIGASSGYEMTCGILSRIGHDEQVSAEFDALKQRKQAMVDRLRIDTPDARVNYLMNGWIKQQMQIYADVGSDNGRGFRDAMQLLWATASYDRDYTRRMLIECLSHQYASGRTLRGWLPIDDHHYCDGPVWIAPVVDTYLRETGDFDFLDQTIPFFDGGEGTAWEHVLRGLRHASDDVGERGMVRMHFGDWNDSLTGIGNAGKGESVWATQGIVYGLKIAADIATRLRKEPAVAKDCLDRAQRLTDAVETHGWDGEWYLRAINDLGQKVGTHTETEGRIYLLPQVWSVIAGMADEARAKQVMGKVDELLDSTCGSLTLSPAYKHPNDNIGRITWMVPGMWENGTPYCHANGFKIVADLMAGRGDKAYATLRKCMPDSEKNPSTHSGCEPYVLTNQHLGPDNPRAGKTLWAWMTGSGGWYYRAVVNYMFGVMPDYHGLRIDPCLPSDWKRVTLQREFRGATYQVEIDSPDGVEKGDVAVLVDGQPLQDGVIPAFGDGKVHRVEVTVTKKVAEAVVC